MAMSWLSQFITPATVTLVGAVLAAIGVFWSAHRQAGLSAQLVSLSAQLVAKSDQLVTKNDELREKSEEIALLSKQGLATVTGGDSFARIEFANWDDPAGPLMSIDHSGKFPLYDISIRVVDLDKAKPNPPGRSAVPLRLDALAESTRILSVVTLPVGLSRIVGNLRVAPGPRRLNAFFDARNGSWVQLIRLHLIGTDWKMATRVVKGDLRDPSTITVLLERVDEGFPRSAAGKVEW